MRFPAANMQNILIVIGLILGPSSSILVQGGRKTNKVLPLHPRFRAHLKCPYADQWLAKGPERAAFELGLDANGRKLQSLDSWDDVVQGSCTYSNTFSGSTTCLQFVGIGWTDEGMTTRCAQESDSAYSTRDCSSNTDADSTAGWCETKIDDNMYETTLLVLSSMADCAGNKMACETFMSGTYTAAGECLTTTTSVTPFTATTEAEVETTTTGATLSEEETTTSENVFSDSSTSDESTSTVEANREVVQGSCTYTNAFSGGMTCLQFEGIGWTDENMAARCEQESDGTHANEGCSDDAMAGWCEKIIDDDRNETTLMVLSSMADCDGNKMACETFVGGTFTADGECSSTTSEEVGEDATSSSWSGTTTTTGGVDTTMKCIIAPGAIGAAHQAGFSKGYSTSCPDTPAQESPYMWPLRWSADVELKSMPYGSDDVLFTSRGKSFYMLDLN